LERNHIRNGSTTTIRDQFTHSTNLPQITHKLSHGYATSSVVKLWIKCVWWFRNDASWPLQALYGTGFLPTMKFQLSQLPMIVGSGRVHP
jgi:hypothetical protein